MRSRSFRDEESMIGRKPEMAQDMLKNTNIPVGEGSKPAQASKIQKIPTLTLFTSGLGNPEKSQEPHDGSQEPHDLMGFKVQTSSPKLKHKMVAGDISDKMSF